MKTKIISDGNLGNFTLDAEFDKEIELYVDNGCYKFNEESKAIKILMLWEPPHLSPELYFYAIEEGHKYDVILTYYDKVLKRCPNAKHFIYQTCWIDKKYKYGEKIFGISSIIGYKRLTDGHILRHNLYEKKHHITKVPSFFFISQHGGPPRLIAEDVLYAFRNNLILGDSKEPVFNYQFHIVIENVKMQNMFTEKITDACRTRVVPIYWGCPNISDYYDTRGMIICNNLEEIIEACEAITEDTYQNMLPYIETNYKKSLKYTDGKKDLSTMIRIVTSNINEK